MRHGNLIGLGEVAAQCQLSPATVSKILGPGSDRYRFPESTVVRVRSAAQRLGWTHPAGRTARSTRRQIGLVSAGCLPHSLGCYGDLPRDLAHRLAFHGLDLVMIPFLESWDLWVRQDRERHLVGAVLLEYLATEAENLIHHSRLPMVLFQYQQDMPADRVEVDHAPGAEALAELVVTKGHRKVLFIANAVPRHSESLRTRESAMRSAVAQVGGTLYCVTGVPAARALLDTHHDITAIVTFHEQELPELLFYLRDRGLQVARDISVASMGGALPITWLVPGITHLETSWQVMAEVAADYLADRIAGETPLPRLYRMPERLVDLGSVVPPRTD